MTPTDTLMETLINTVCGAPKQMSLAPEHEYTTHPARAAVLRISQPPTR